MDLVIKKKMDVKDLLGKYGYPLLAIIGTASLATTAISLLPISNWAKNQNDCMVRTVAYDGLPDKVWSCNGGGN